jgi:DNA-binding XRE family transcriptional regulator
MQEGVVGISTNNPVRAVREKLMISRSELARGAGISVITLERIENGKPFRLDTKRKIVKALGFNPWLNNERISFPDR